MPLFTHNHWGLSLNYFTLYALSTVLGGLHMQDDLLLLAPTRSGMKELINICEELSKEFYISFNSAKSKHIEFTKSKDSPSVSFQV